jgi:hypothetical protein
MKTIYLIGFQGTGIRPQYQNENGLILLGHVGLAFEDNRQQILGFHPTKAALATFDSPQAALKWLRDRKTLNGALQDDTEIFKRAAILARDNPHLNVWEYSIKLEDKKFDNIKKQTMTWYNEGTLFPYGLPAQNQNWDNCATFPRQLGLELPESTGNLYLYIGVLKKIGQLWKIEAE